MTNKYIFEPTPLTDFPPKGKYRVFFGDNMSAPVYEYDGYNWLHVPKTVTHYLRPILKSEYEREIRKDEASLSWSAATEWQYEAHYGKVPNTKPNLETYLSKL